VPGGEHLAANDVANQLESEVLQLIELGSRLQQAAHPEQVESPSTTHQVEANHVQSCSQQMLQVQMELLQAAANQAANQAAAHHSEQVESLSAAHQVEVNHVQSCSQQMLQVQMELLQAAANQAANQAAAHQLELEHTHRKYQQQLSELESQLQATAT